jgi:release factor glutamine methyltransferase
LLRDGVATLQDISATPHLDADILLAAVLEQDRAHLLAHPESEVPDVPAAHFRHLLARRTTGEPVAYLTGTREF